MASTYPLEVVEATRFVKANPKLAGDQLGAALKQKTWDDSVKSLVAFPQVLETMNDKLDWMQKLGDAFLAQQKDVMDAVQRLRARAHTEGNLISTAEQAVTLQPAPVSPPAAASTIITIEPTNPQVVYVPTYNPTVVYGAWPYSAYPPYTPTIRPATPWRRRRPLPSRSASAWRSEPRSGAAATGAAETSTSTWTCTTASPGT